MNTPCPADEILSRLIDGELPAAETGAAISHAQSCLACHEKLAAYRATAALLTAAAAPVVEVEEAGVSPQLLERLRAIDDARAAATATTRRTSSRRMRVSRRARRAGGLSPSIAAAAVLLLGLGTFVFLSQDGRSARRVREQTRTPAPARPLGPHPLEVAREERSGRTIATARTGPERRQLPAGRPAIPPLPVLSPAPAREPAARGSVSAQSSIPGAAAAAGESQTAERAIARIARVEGLVMYARGAKGRWAQATAGISLLAGDRIDTRTGMARLDLDAAAIYANKKTVLRLLRAVTGAGEAYLASLERGEIYVAEAGARKLVVETPDGLFTPVGTRFGVKRVGVWSVVTVEEGAVEARARRRRSRVQGPESGVSEIGTRDLKSATWAETWTEQPVRVEAGKQARVERGATPRVLQAARLAGLWSWRYRISPLASGRGPLAAGRAAYWSVDEGRGTLARDVSGRGNDGTLQGGATWTRGRVGGAIDLNGTDGYVALARPVIGDREAFTIAGWIRTTSRQRSDIYGEIKGEVFAPGATGPNLNLNLNEAAGGQLQFVWRPRALSALRSGVDVADGAWHHFAVVRDAGRLALFVDGRQTGSRGGIAGTIAADAAVIGGGFLRHRPSFFAGSLDELRIYHRALSAAEIETLFTLRSPPGGQAR